MEAAPTTRRSSRLRARSAVCPKCGASPTPSLPNSWISRTRLPLPLTAEGILRTKPFNFERRAGVALAAKRQGLGCQRSSCRSSRLPAEHRAFAGESPMITCELAVLAKYAMARHYERERVLADCSAHGACGFCRTDLDRDV